MDSLETVHPYLPVEPLGIEASIFTHDTLTGKTVQLEYDGTRWDMYGRIFAYLWVDGKLFNETLLEKGLAHTAYVYEPRYKHFRRIINAQKKAQSAHKGIWSIKTMWGENI